MSDVVSAAMYTRPRAIARRWLASFGVTSTMRARPRGSRWVRPRSDMARKCRCLVRRGGRDRLARRRVDHRTLPERRIEGDLDALELGELDAGDAGGIGIRADADLDGDGVGGVGDDGDVVDAVAGFDAVEEVDLEGRRVDEGDRVDGGDRSPRRGRASARRARRRHRRRRRRWRAATRRVSPSTIAPPSSSSRSRRRRAPRPPRAPCCTAADLSEGHATGRGHALTRQVDGRMHQPRPRVMQPAGVMH